MLSLIELTPYIVHCVEVNLYPLVACVMITDKLFRGQTEGHDVVVGELRLQRTKMAGRLACPSALFHQVCKFPKSILALTEEDGN